MPKFCQTCGNLVDDSAVICNACGSPMTNAYPEDPVTVNAQNAYSQQQFQPQFTQQQYTQQQYTQQQYTQQPYEQQQYPQQYQAEPALQPPKKSKKGLIIGLSIGGAVLAAAIVVFFVWILPMISGTGSPQACIDGIIDKVAEGDIDGALDYIYETKFAPQLKEQAKKSMTSQSGFEQGLMMIKAMGKDGIRNMIDIKCGEEKEVSSTEKDQIIQALKQATVPTDDIQKIVTVNLKLVNKMTSDTQETPCYFVKAKGGYYLLISPLVSMQGSSVSGSDFGDLMY